MGGGHILVSPLSSCPVLVRLIQKLVSVQYLFTIRVNVGHWASVGTIGHFRIS